MNSVQKIKVLSFLNSEIDRATKELNPGNVYSNPFSGDSSSVLTQRFYIGDTKELSIKYLDALKILREEVETQNDQTNDIVKPVSFVEVEYNDLSHLEFIYADNAISFPKLLFVSSRSPLGKAVYGKKQGDPFSYTLNNGEKTFSGKIIKIE